MPDILSVVKNLHACLLSIKGGISLRALERDYRTIVGNNIPYREFGYSSLEQFLKTVEDVRIYSSGGELMIDTVPKETNAHLAALVARQKSAPKKAKIPLRNNIPPRRSAQIQRRGQSPNKGYLRRFDSKPITKTVHWGPSTVSSYREELPVHAVPKAQSIPPLLPAKQIEAIPPLLSVKQDLNARRQSSPKPAGSYSPQSPDVCVQYEPRRSLPIITQTTQDIQSLLYYQVQPPSATVTHEVNRGPLLPTPVTQLSENVRKCKISTSPTKIKESLRKTRKKVSPSIVIDFGFLPRRGTGGEKLYTDKLYDYTKEHGFAEPTYKLAPRKPKGEPFVYSCVVKVDQHTFNNYPDEKRTPEEAAEAVAKLAVLELTKMKKSLSGGSGDLNITTNKTEIIRRVNQIVAHYHSGVFTTQIPVDYIKFYSESLPNNWQDMVIDCPTIAHDSIAGKTIFYPVDVDENQHVEKVQGSVQNSVVEKQALPPLLTFPEEKIWDVYVTSAVSTDEVWVRLIGDSYSGNFEKMVQAMDDYYPHLKKAAANLNVGSFYAVEADDSWHRVELLEITNDEAYIYFIDHGDEATVPCDKLFILDLAFAEMPQQAIACSLAGMNDFSDDPYAVSLLEERVIGNTFVAEVATQSISDDGIELILYDTSTEEDVNINELLTNKIRQHLFTPELPQDGTVKDVFVSSISHNGDVYVHVNLKALELLNTQIQLLMEAKVNENLSKASDITRNTEQLYLSEFKPDGCLYRAKIVKEHPETNEADIIFVDYGNSEIVKLEDLILLDNLDEELECIPYQAIRVNMHNLPPSVFNEKISYRLLELVPQTDTVLLKVVKPASDGKPAEVELFKRITDEKLLVSINNTLALDPNLISGSAASSGTEVQRKKRVERLQSSSSTGKNTDNQSAKNDYVSNGIPPPRIPPVSAMFDVHVTMASNPGNFMVQPYDNMKDLNALMEKLQTVCEAMDSTSFPSSVVEGDYYAALHTDKLWYRVKVTNVMNDAVISVYFCDYGDVSVLPREALRPLDDEFKVLCYQAIKAKLYGVKPMHGDWSVDDCLQFQNLVVEKQFVSLVMDTGPDVINPHDTVLSLKLIDTTTNIDFCINDMLVTQNRALRIPGTKPYGQDSFQFKRPVT